MTIEKLEKRVLLSVSLNLQTQLLSISATRVGDVVSVTKSSNNIVVLDAGVTTNFAAAQVRAISATLGAGADKVTIGSTVTAPVTVLAGSGNDVIVGGGGNDSFVAGAGNDSLVGGLAASTLVAGSGLDTLVGNGTGTDYVFVPQNVPTKYVLSQAKAGNAYLDFSALPAGNDVVANLNYDFLAAYNNVSIVDAKAGQDANFGGIIDGGGDDTLTANNRGDLIDAGNGTDMIVGGTGADSINLGNGIDVVSGEGGADRIFGGSGTYIIYATDATSDPAYKGIPSSIAKPTNPSPGVYVDGGTGTASIVGGPGNDTLRGEGSDTIHGLAGNDFITGGTGICLLYGDAGNDTIFGDAGPTSIYGGDGDDNLTAGTAGDLVAGGAGNNTLYASIGEDTLYGGDAPGMVTIPVNATYHNLLLGGEGDCVMYAGNGGDTLEGGDGNDTLVGGSGNDIISGGGGNNYMDGGAGINTVTYAQDTEGVTISPDGTADSGDPEQTDTILPNFQILIGGSSDDFIFAGNYSSTLIGGAGNDYMAAGAAGNDLMVGNGGNNTLFGGPGSDTLYGGDEPGIPTFSGPDTYSNQLFGGGGSDLLIAGAGGDMLQASSQGHSTLFGGIGNDTLYGGNAGDLIFGGPGNDSLIGGSANDTIYGGTGADTIEGNDGGDLLSANNPSQSVIGTALNNILQAQAVGASPNQDSGDLIDGGTGNDTINGGAGDTTLDGGDGNDTIIAGAGNTVLYGGFGNDSLQAGSGLDTLDGGPGNDSLLGGTNDDVFANNDSDTAIVVGGTGLNSAQATLPGRDQFTNIQFFYDLIPGYAPPAAASSFAKPLALPPVTAPTLSKGLLTVNGTAGNDTIYVYELTGTLFASINGSIFSYPMSNVTSVVVNGGNGNDTIQAALPTYQEALTLPATLNGGNGNDSIIGAASVEQINGDAGNDILYSNYVGNVVNGGAGTDILVDGARYASGQESFLGGGGGNDTVDFEGRTPPLTLYMDGTARSGSAGQNDIISADIKNMYASGNDVVFGNALDNYIDCGTGHCTVYGEAGNDQIVASGATDTGGNTCYGNAGKNFFELQNNAQDFYSAPFRQGIDAVDVLTGDQQPPGAAPVKALASSGLGKVFSNTPLSPAAEKLKLKIR